MQIVLRSVPNPPVPIQEVRPVGPGGPGHRFVFSEDFDLVSIDGRAAQTSVRSRIQDSSRPSESPNRAITFTPRAIT